MSERTALNQAFRALQDARWATQDVKWYRFVLRSVRRSAFDEAVVDFASVVLDAVESQEQKGRKK